MVVCRLLFVLANAQYEADEQRIVFIVDDSFLRKSLPTHLKEEGAFADNSFASELVKIAVEQLSPVLEYFYGAKFAVDFVKGMKETKNDSNFVAVRKAFVPGPAKALGGGVVVAVKDRLGGA